MSIYFISPSGEIIEDAGCRNHNESAKRYLEKRNISYDDQPEDHLVNKGFLKVRDEGRVKTVTHKYWLSQVQQDLVDKLKMEGFVEDIVDLGS